MAILYPDFTLYLHYHAAPDKSVWNRSRDAPKADHSFTTSQATKTPVLSYSP